MTTLDIRLHLSDDVLSYLQEEAQRRAQPLDAIVSDILMDYFMEPDDDAILDGLRRSMEQIVAGDYRPAHEVLDEIEDEIENEAMD